MQGEGLPWLRTGQDAWEFLKFRKMGGITSIVLLLCEAFFYLLFFRRLIKADTDTGGVTQQALGLLIPALQ